jgi:methylmalonyl-CoA mutase N-terminal domain/subunit
VLDPAVRERQIARLHEFKEEREAARVEAALGALQTAAEGKENLMPLVLEAVRAHATLGEVVDVFRATFGEYRKVSVL